MITSRECINLKMKHTQTMFQKNVAMMHMYML